jgi:hypothetical protein
MDEEIVARGSYQEAVRVEPQTPTVPVAVIEDAFEDALGLARPALAAVDVIARAEGLY